VALGLAPVTAMFTTTRMAPDDIEYKGLELSNTGNLALRYAINTIADDRDILDKQLDLTIDVVIGPGGDREGILKFAFNPWIRGKRKIMRMATKNEGRLVRNGTTSPQQ